MMMRRHIRWPAAFGALLLVLLLVGGRARPVAGDTYVIPDDYRVACLDSASGKVVWEVSPGELGEPRLRLADNGDIVADDGRRAYRLDPKGGGVLATRERKAPAPPQGAELEPLGSLDSKLGRLSFRSGYSRHLALQRDGAEEVVRELEWYPKEVQAAGDLAVFTYGKDDAGTVYAWDLARRRLAWAFDPATAAPGLADTAYASLATDGERVLVSYDETIFALASGSGRLLWKRALPRQTIRRYDAAWTRFFRHGDMVLARVYEDLFALRGDDGRLLWRFDAGPFARPAPLVAGGLLCSQARRDPARQTSASFVGPRDPVMVARVRADRRRGAILDLIPRATVPAGATLLSLLDSPAPGGRGGRRVFLRAASRLEGEDLVFEIELTRALAARKEVYVRVTRWVEPSLRFAPPRR